MGLKLKELEDLFKHITAKPHTDLRFTLNDHKCYYITAAECDRQGEWKPESWLTKEEYRLAMENDTVWEFYEDHWEITSDESVTLPLMCGHSLLAMIATIAFNHGIVDIAPLHETIVQLEAKFKTLLKGKHTLMGFSYENMENKPPECTLDEWLEMNDLVSDKVVTSDTIGQITEKKAFWRFYWYPHTPVGFQQVFDISFESLMDYVVNQE